MKKGDILEGFVNEYQFPNKGIVRLMEEKVVVKNSLPGQHIRFMIQKKRKGKCEGRLLEVLKESKLETRRPYCDHFGECGGCAYQRIPYEKQLNLKAAMVKDIIDNVCTGYEFIGIKGSPSEWGYRNKMEFSFGDAYKDGPLTLGLHKKGSMYDIVEAGGCKIAEEDFSRILCAVLNYFQEKNMSFYHKVTHTGYLRHLLIRRAERTGELTAGLVTSGELPGTKDGQTVFDEKDILQDFKELLLGLPLSGKLVGICHIVNDSLADVVRSDRTEILYGRDYFYEELLGLTFKISMFSFFQTNSAGAEALYQTVREFIGDIRERLIFDLYSGTGTIAQILAPVAKKVIGVEIVEEAVEAARENARINGLANCEFIAGDVLKVMDTIREKPDVIVLDPPRDGVHPKALGKIIDFGVERIVYISCKPTSLARDLVVFQERGYRLVKACAVDLFAQTRHVETVCLLSNRKPDTKVRIDVDLEDYYRIKDAKKNQN